MAAGNTYEAIATQTVSGTSTATVTFSSIASTYTDLIIIANGGSNGGSLRMQFNSDTATNYSVTILAGTGSAANSTRQASQNAILIAGIYAGGSANSNSITQIQNYSNATTYKTALSRNNDAAGETNASVGLWRSTSAINTIAITAINGTGTWTNGSTISLYGIKAA
jgi:hypothetical protein